MKSIIIKSLFCSFLLVFMCVIHTGCNNSLDAEDPEGVVASSITQNNSYNKSEDSILIKIDSVNDIILNNYQQGSRSFIQLPEWVQTDCYAACAAYSSTWYIVHPGARLFLCGILAAASSAGVALENEVYENEQPSFNDFLNVVSDSSGIEISNANNLSIPQKYLSSAIRVATIHNEILNRLDNSICNTNMDRQSVPNYSIEDQHKIYDYFSCQSLNDVNKLFSDSDYISKAIIERFLSASSLASSNSTNINFIIEPYSNLIENETALSEEQKMGIYIAMSVYIYSNEYWSNKNSYPDEY